MSSPVSVGNRKKRSLALTNYAIGKEILVFVLVFVLCLVVYFVFAVLGCLVLYFVFACLGFSCAVLSCVVLSCVVFFVLCCVVCCPVLCCLVLFCVVFVWSCLGLGLGHGLVSSCLILPFLCVMLCCVVVSCVACLVSFVVSHALAKDLHRPLSVTLPRFPSIRSKYECRLTHRTGWCAHGKACAQGVYARYTGGSMRVHLGS
jgi:hypothetical protein